jgi:hypothetical protein
VIESTTITGPDGTKAAMLKSAEVLDALLWIAGCLMTGVPQASTPDGRLQLEDFRELTRAQRRAGVAAVFDIIRPTAPH